MMTPPEIDEVLKTFSVIVDTREQATDKALERYEAFGCPYDRATLRYGDYCANVTLPSGQLVNTSEPVSARCVIERKMSMEELSACLTRERKRFEREFQRASDNDAKIYLLVENGSWEGIIMHRYKTKFTPQAFLASLTAWTVRYNMTPIFCKSATSGKLIREILFRDIKERLERGEFD